MPEQLWKSPWRRWTQTVGTLPLRGGGSACRKSVHVKNTRGPASPLRPKTKTAPDRLQCEPEPEYGTRISASVHGGWFELAASGADGDSRVRNRLRRGNSGGCEYGIPIQLAVENVNALNSRRPTCRCGKFRRSPKRSS